MVDDLGNCRAIAWQAETYAALRGGWYVERGPLIVPRRWLAWLLMNDAGVPAVLIARRAGLSPAFVSIRIRAARALTAWPSFGEYARACAARMPRWDGAH